MLIRELTEEECRRVLERLNFGRLGCALDNQPYVVPIYFSYDGRHLYGFSTPGQKIEWMRANPLVCLEVDERTSPDDWMSVVVSGRYQELPDTPEFRDLRNRAYNLLRRTPVWWEPGYAKTIVDGSERPLGEAVYFRVHIEQISGRRAVPDKALG